MKVSLKKLMSRIVTAITTLLNGQLKCVDVSGTTNSGGYILLPNINASKMEVVSVVSLNTGGYVTLFGRYSSGYVMYLGGNAGSGFTLYPNTGFNVRVWYYDK